MGSALCPGTSETPEIVYQRNAKAAKRSLDKTLSQRKEWEKPRVINIDKAPTYAVAIEELKAVGKLPADTEHRQVKYLNNVIEADHGKLKRLIKPTWASNP